MYPNGVKQSQAAYKALIDHTSIDTTGNDVLKTRKLAVMALTFSTIERVEGNFFWANTASPAGVEGEGEGEVKVNLPASPEHKGDALKAQEGDFFWAATASQFDFEESDNVKVALPGHLQHDEDDQGSEIDPVSRRDSLAVGKLRPEAAIFTPSAPVLRPDAAAFRPATATLLTPPLNGENSTAWSRFAEFIDDESPIPEEYRSTLQVEYVYPPSPPLEEEDGDQAVVEQTMPMEMAAGVGMVRWETYPIPEVEEEDEVEEEAHEEVEAHEEAAHEEEPHEDEAHEEGEESEGEVEEEALPHADPWKGEKDCEGASFAESIVAYLM